MPKRTDIHSIMVIGAGPIIIGQACEFDYSGVQACKALKQEGYRVILVNSNPATIMTDPHMADATYIEPITSDMLEKIILKEKPDALLPTMGGQTALNATLDLVKTGFLEKQGVEVIGATEKAIEKAEDRELFRAAMDKIGLESARSEMVSSLAEAKEALKHTGLPSIIRPSFTMGGTGGGIAETEEEFIAIVESGIAASPVGTVLVEESLLGWKEYEMEVVRDKNDNAIIICSIENVDPMGVHTGDSITVAPALTLTDKEYQIMRNASIAILREIGVETGGSNVQFSVNPKDGRLVVIEMNPRVSRSSALASKATGFPIAKIAAKLAVGYTLDELGNDITDGKTPASFEPTIDYVVTKIPRFTFEKFAGTDPTLTTAMKSVGEAMSIGRCFQESLQKALRSMETGLTGLNSLDLTDKAAIEKGLIERSHNRILIIADAFRQGFTVERIQELSGYEPWFLRQIEELIQIEEAVKKDGLPTEKAGITFLKQKGFSDERLAELSGISSQDMQKKRHDLGVRPVYKKIDTCAAEFASSTPYMYSTYEMGDTPDCEAAPSNKKKVIILGGGPNRIGQGIEFDYCCVHAVFALQEVGVETIMVNCNPETVSTDYDTSDRLYFEPLTPEDVIEIIRKEQENGDLLGVFVQFGGQTPLRLAERLEEENIPILGTSPDSIDLAEDRDRFQRLLKELKLKQPENGIAFNQDQAIQIATDIGYPVVVRPSYVLGGRAMEIVHSEEFLRKYMTTAVKVSGKNPVLIDSFLKNAIEIDVDALCDCGDGRDTVYVAGIMEHIEEAGIHSGDSACSLPPQSLSDDVIEDIKQQTRALGKALQVIGLMNIQFAICEGEIYVIEVNPRSSRTVPFVAKATGVPIAKLAAQVMVGEKITWPDEDKKADYVAVKEAVFPFSRFPGVDVILGPEMKSTGEVMGIDRDFARAFAKAQIGAGANMPLEGTVFISVKEGDKAQIVGSAKMLIEMGFKIVATTGTQKFLAEQGVSAEQINKVSEGSSNIVGAMNAGEIDLVLNTTEGRQTIIDSFSLRRTALTNKISYCTTLAGAKATVRAIKALKEDALDVCSLQEYHK
ncbi:MAG: carbamoyl-phosphate synthase large subunit [Alphaproteobacteria bacterium]